MTRRCRSERVNRFVWQTAGALADGLPLAHTGALAAAVLAALVLLALGWWWTVTVRRLAQARAAGTKPPCG